MSKLSLLFFSSSIVNLTCTSTSRANYMSNSWNLILDALAEGRVVKEFYQQLHIMFQEDVKPDSITIVSVIQLGGDSFQTRIVKEAHGFSLRSGLFPGNREPTLANALIDAYARCLFPGNREPTLANALIDAYARCENMEYVNSGLHDNAKTIFENMTERDLTTWNLMSHKLKPDTLAIMSLLPVATQKVSVQMVRQCHGHSGLVDTDEGLKIFHSLNKINFKPIMEQYTCVVDLLAQNGRINDAYAFITSMRVEPSANVWGRYWVHYDKSRMPVCRFFRLYGECREQDCVYKHTNEDVKECHMYKLGFCPNGPDCRYKHAKLPGPPPPVQEVLRKIQQLTSHNYGNSNRFFHNRNANHSQGPNNVNQYCSSKLRTRTFAYEDINVLGSSTVLWFSGMWKDDLIADYVTERCTWWREFL
ncbi:tetratricopeptide repeat (TPR)-like superfamily protein [Artemisia annua]|uniref:Tetratricopeptide repeat (TPR)-like superfamily protein n=1 Tax=Artemisia annua TaxID=35608 RepID=A0A2U1MGX5_ARTAN|nr:tetratricopeptide repeat (TPR)-like superfamily protein [Artemisia annua]